MRKFGIWFFLILFFLATIVIFMPILETFLVSPLVRGAILLMGVASILLRSIPRLSSAEFKERNVFWSVSAVVLWIIALLLRPQYAVLSYGILLAAAHFDFFWQKRTNQIVYELREKLGKYLDSSVVDIVVSETGVIGGTASRIQTTVLFVDIRGYTRLSERLDPAKLLSQLNDFLSTMGTIIKAHHGITDKFIGDAVMAVFGIVSKNSKHYLDAINAACRMLEVIEKLNLSWLKKGLTPLKIGVGLCMGDVILGNVGSHEHANFTAIGDTVNTASRLSSVAKANEILICGIGPDVITGFDEALKLELVGPIKLKGKESDVITYRVVRSEKYDKV